MQMPARPTGALQESADERRPRRAAPALPQRVRQAAQPRRVAAGGKARHVRVGWQRRREQAQPQERRLRHAAPNGAIRAHGTFQERQRVAAHGLLIQRPAAADVHIRAGVRDIGEQRMETPFDGRERAPQRGENDADARVRVGAQPLPRPHRCQRQLVAAVAGRQAAGGRGRRPLPSGGLFAARRGEKAAQCGGWRLHQEHRGRWRAPPARPVREAHQAIRQFRCRDPTFLAQQRLERLRPAGVHGAVFGLFERRLRAGQAVQLGRAPRRGEHLDLPHPTGVRRGPRHCERGDVVRQQRGVRPRPGFLRGRVAAGQEGVHAQHIRRRPSLGAVSRPLPLHRVGDLPRPAARGRHHRSVRQRRHQRVVPRDQRRAPHRFFTHQLHTTMATVRATNQYADSTPMA